VTNTNAPDRDRALANPSDVQALVSGAFWTWYNAQHNYGISMSPALSNMSFQHASAAANFGQVDFSTIPRVPMVNQTSWTNYNQFAGHWTQYYRSIAAVNAGLAAMDAGSVDLGDQTAMTRAYARFIQGISHGTIAILFEQGPIVDENSNLEEPQAYVSSQDLLTAALGFLDDAISISNANSFSLPTQWFGGLFDEEISSATFAQMASSYKAMLIASHARTPAQADQIDWTAVLTAIDNGVEENVEFQFDGGTAWFGSLYYTLLRGSWHNVPYTVFGMADQSGKYQEWIGLPAGQRSPSLPSGEFLIITPDTRFPQGATIEAQQADVRPMDEQRYVIPSYFGEQWARPDRGTWRWSYYRDIRTAGLADVGRTPYISYREQRLLAAEAQYRLGNMGAAADIINETRVAAGLNATNAAGLNTSCVPKLPDGSCGDLWEMLKWERRLEASHEGHYLMAPMYFDSRRWGDLMEGTIITFPVPCRDAQLEGDIACENRGGVGGEGAAARGTYGY
jgi:hypothetical protein